MACKVRRLGLRENPEFPVWMADSACTQNYLRNTPNFAVARTGAYLRRTAQRVLVGKDAAMNVPRSLQLNATVSSVVLAAALALGASFLAPAPAPADDSMVQSHTQ